ncbi:hypothetical protein [Halolamina sp.]|uniref:hypothetical protein n=1 Tax=Halolamina sp. TaxID=1940283 RepID=UPI000223B6FB|nr:hypothetical protein Halar_1280 [halophilic archaeon DL31]
MRIALAPIARLLVTFGIVWFYHALTTSFVPSGWPQAAVVIALGIPTWLLVGRYLFPAEGDSPFPGRK